MKREHRNYSVAEQYPLAIITVIAMVVVSLLVLASSPDFLFGTTMISIQEVVLASILLFVLAGIIFANAQWQKLKRNFKFLASIDLEDELQKITDEHADNVNCMESRIERLKKKLDQQAQQCETGVGGK